MKPIILALLLLSLFSCNESGTTASETSLAPPETPENKAVAVVKPSFKSATEVYIYDLSDKYLNGLRDLDTASNIITKEKWEQLCISQNPTNKEWAFPMASVHLLDINGNVAEDSTYSDYIKNNWFYGIDMDNAQVLDKNGALISNDFNWLINQSTAILQDFLPADSALYIFTNKMISAGHHYRSDGAMVGTLLYNIGDIKAMLNTLNNVEVHYFCMAF